MNLIEPGKNYGWPLVSYGANYGGQVGIPNPDTRPDLTKPVLYWVPVIAPGNLVFYKGSMFPQWEGSALASGMASRSLTRITFDGKGGATVAERFNVEKNVRDVAVAPDGATQISSAGVIVETSLEGYPLDASSGSHFFHNVTSMNVGYFSIQQELSGSFIRWEILDQQELVQRTPHFKHVRFRKPLQIKMDGKKRIAAVIWDS